MFETLFLSSQRADLTSSYYSVSSLPPPILLSVRLVMYPAPVPIHIPQALADGHLSCFCFLAITVNLLIFLNMFPAYVAVVLSSFSSSFFCPLLFYSLFPSLLLFLLLFAVPTSSSSSIPFPFFSSSLIL